MDASESWLVLRAQSGDRESLERLLRRVHGPLLGFLTRVMRDRAAAEDVLQDTLLIVVRKLRWLESPEAFRPWAYRIAARAAMKELRREQRRFSAIDPHADPEAMSEAAAAASLRQAQDGDCADDDVIDRLPGLLQTVSPASRAVLVLHYLEGLPLQAVSDILEIPLGTVKSRLAYGLHVLRARANV
jgi:RNA polymerase sigma-70 factor (ECF subfamily)